MTGLNDEKPTRRACFGFARTGLILCAGRLAFAADFWNRKPASMWSDDEIGQLTTRSPWAREVNAEFIDDATYTTGSAGGPQVGPGGVITAPRDRTGGSYEMGADGRAPRGGAHREPVTVRWESAQPMLDALHTPLKSELKDRYVLSVSNLPIGVMESRRQKERAPGLEEDNSPLARQLRMIEQLQGSATLEARGKDPAQAGVVTTAAVPGTYLFGFSKEFLTIGASDKDVLFTLQTGLMTVRAKFQPKEMIYRGKLAL